MLRHLAPRAKIAVLACKTAPLARVTSMFSFFSIEVASCALIISTS